MKNITLCAENASCSRAGDGEMKKKRREREKKLDMGIHGSWP